MIERNLMEHVYYTYRQAAVALGDHQTAEAYQQLGQLLALLRLVPEEEPRRSALAEEAREGVEKAMAALRIGDIFAARDGARLAGPFCMSYRTMRPSRAAPSETGPSP
jgi:hypothetical protein